MRLLLPALLLLAPLAASAQQDERLPDLTPREFEIRGELQVSLPDLERQPLRGFAPPPRTYIVPADRQPHVSPYAQRLDDLPPHRMAAPAAPSLLRAEPRIGQLDLLAGRYLARRGRLTINTHGFSLDAAYSGYSDFAASSLEPDLTASADGLRGRIGYTTGHRLRFTMGLDGAYHEYSLFDAHPAALASVTRSLRTIGGEARLAGAGDEAGILPFEVMARYESSGIGDTVPGLLEGPGEDGPDETRFLLGGSVEAGQARVDAGASFSRLAIGLDGTSTGDPLVTAFRAGAAFDIPMGDSRLAVGARLLGYASSFEPDADHFTVGPIVEFDMPLGEAVRFYAQNRPHLNDRGQRGLFGDNPYATVWSRPFPDVVPVEAEAGIEVQSRVVRFKAYGLGSYSPSSRYFMRTIVCPACTPSDRTQYGASYDAMSRLGGGADLTFYAPGNISVSLGAELRSTRFAGGGAEGTIRPMIDEIPFVSPLVGRAALAVPFAGTRGLVQTTLHFEGARPTEFEGETAPAWADLSLEAHYRFAGRFGLVGRADHLAGRAEQWPGFPRPPVILTAGVRAGW
jgi:hypothetical protein